MKNTKTLSGFTLSTLVMLVSYSAFSWSANMPSDPSAGAQQISGASQQQTADKITEAERQLFLEKHFADTTQKQIDYVYRQSGPSMEKLDDKVKVDVREHHNDGTASVNVNFLTGDNHTPIEPIDHAEGNPALLGFLERDIAQMKRLTGGSTVYFRKRIRLALADEKVKVDKVNVNYENKKVAAKRIEIAPYLNDPMKDRIGKYSAKRYVFILSPQIPGGVYQVYTSEKFADNQPAQVDTSMTITGGEIPG